MKDSLLKFGKSLAEELININITVGDTGSNRRREEELENERRFKADVQRLADAYGIRNYELNVGSSRSQVHHVKPIEDLGKDELIARLTVCKAKYLQLVNARVIKKHDLRIRYRNLDDVVNSTISSLNGFIVFDTSIEEARTVLSQAEALLSVYQ